MLNEPQGRLTYDSQELKDIAAAIKAKFEEFNVMGWYVQINPGPVVTTFEFKPEAGVKYSRITTLTEDLRLGLQPNRSSSSASPESRRSASKSRIANAK